MLLEHLGHATNLDPLGTLNNWPQSVHSMIVRSMNPNVVWYLFLQVADMALRVSFMCKGLIEMLWRGLD